MLLKKSLVVASLPCNGFVSVAFFVISLIVFRFMLNHITFKRKETNMKHIKEVISNVKTKVMNGVISIIETVWAIGTSIAGTDVL